MTKCITCLILIMCLALFGCNYMSSEILIFLTVESTMDWQHNLEEGTLESPAFVMIIDKTFLEFKIVKNTRVFITTELEKWPHIVEIESGSISEIKSHSLVCVEREDEDQENDIIMINVASGDSKVQHIVIIPLNYIFVPKTIVR